MKRCTLFLSTAGGLSPYGTFTNITTDQTSGVCRQIWHTYLNEQQGSPGSLGRCETTSAAESLRAAPLLSKDTLDIYHSFHFCQGKKLICPRSTKNEKKVFFFPPQEINVPDKWGFCPFGFVERQQTSVLRSRGNVCMGLKQPEIGLWMGNPVNILKKIIQWIK